MRIYNGKDSLVCLPLNATQRISIDPHSVSGDFLPSTEFITMVISAYNTDELALIVASPFEINICANIVGAVSYVVQSLDEAITRFAIPKEEAKKEVKIEEPVKPQTTKPEATKKEEHCCCEACECKEVGDGEETCCNCDVPSETPQPQEEIVVEEPKPKKKGGRKKSKD